MFALALLAGLLPAQRDGSGFDALRVAGVAALLEQEVKAGHTAGASFLLLRHGKEVASAAVGLADVAGAVPMKRDTIVRIYSMTKAITAVAALTLFDGNVLRLDSPITEWLPELKEVKVWSGGTLEAPVLTPAARAITVRMLLNHTAGFSYDFFRDSPVGELYRKADLWGSSSLDEFLTRVAKLPLLSQPGEQWHYSIADDVLGVLIERASKQPFADYVKEHVTGPLRMVDTDFDVPETKRARLATMYRGDDGTLKPLEPTFGVYAEPDRGFAAGGAGLFSTLDDYARFCRMLLGKGELDGVRILSRKTMELAALDSLRGTQNTGRAGDGWGLICAVRSDPGASSELGSLGMLHWSGAATTHFFADPVEDLVAVLFCQHLPYDQHHLIPRFHTAIYSALR